MCNYLSRRRFLQIGTTGAMVAMLPALQAQQDSSNSRLQMAGPLKPFPLSAVRLLDGEFKRSAEINAAYLDSLQVERLLHSFRLTSGLSSSAAPYGGWELPTSELRGHFAGGHYLSAVALAYASSGNEVLRGKGNDLVSGLAACQKANGNGYVGAYPPAFFERLARAQEVWAPFYTYHKILAGLVDMYLHTGNEQALAVAEGMAGWIGGYFADISQDQRQRMLRVEYGGMNEVLINLYAITHKERYLATARKFEQPSFLDPLAARRDELQGLHANTNVPKVIGAARMYEETGDTRYRRIAEYFLDEVLSARTYAIGNTSDDEHWRSPAGDLTGTLSLKNAECCVAYNLMKLDRHLFGWTGDSRWMDAYERTLFNTRLGTQNASGLKQYFFPLAAGYWRAYGSPTDSFWCCTGTGAEDFAKFNDTIYFHKGETVYVNQFISSLLTWKEKDFVLRQQTNFPNEQTIRLTVETTHPHERELAIRIPSWTASGGGLSLNGKPLDAFAEPGSYLTLRRTWHNGDKLVLTLPMSLREENLPGDYRTVAALYGPLVLASALGEGPSSGPTKVITGRATEPKVAASNTPLPLASSSTQPAGWLKPVAGETLRFETTQASGPPLQVLPMYQIEDQRYSVYWKKEV